MLEIILLAVAPVIVNFATQGIKKLHAIKFSPNRKTMIRFASGVCAFVAVLLGGLASGEMIDQEVIVTFVEGVAVFVAAQVTYFLAKKEKSDMI